MLVAAMLWAVLLILNYPAGLSAEHTANYCHGGETGYWMPGKAEDDTIMLMVVKQDGSIEPENVLCIVRSHQRIRVIATGTNREA